MSNQFTTDAPLVWINKLLNRGIGEYTFVTRLETGMVTVNTVRSLVLEPLEKEAKSLGYELCSIVHFTPPDAEGYRTIEYTANKVRSND